MSRPPPHERPTPDQLIGASSYICPHCGAAEWRGEMKSKVETTRHPDGRITTVRYRLCQCRQHRFRTEETVVPDGHKLKVVPEEEEEVAA